MERPHITDSTGAAPGAAIVIEDDSPFTGTQDSFCTPERALLSPSQSSLPPPRTFLKWLHLGPGITPCNFMAYLCATLLSICLFVFLNASQVCSRIFTVAPFGALFGNAFKLINIVTRDSSSVKSSKSQNLS